MIRALLIVLAVVLSVLPAGAARVVSSVSNTAISISSSFDGETLTMFGNIEPELGTTEPLKGPFHVVIVVEGPLSDRVTRLKTNNFGIWMNTVQVRFTAMPTYFQVLSDDKLKEITNPVTIAEQKLLPEYLAQSAIETGWWDSLVFANQTVRLLTEKGVYGVREDGVKFLSNTFYSAQLTLPANVPNGAFLARTYVFQNGEIIARKSDGFAVRKSGFERFIGQSANQFPLLYGLVCVALALFTGWLGGVVFKR